MSKIIATEWRSARNTVGIVATEVRGEKWRAYIGFASIDALINPSEDASAEYIAAYGAKLCKREAVAFFPYLDAGKFDEER